MKPFWSNPDITNASIVTGGAITHHLPELTVAEQSASARALALDSCQTRRTELMARKSDIEAELSILDKEIKALEAAEKIVGTSLLNSEELKDGQTQETVAIGW